MREIIHLIKKDCMLIVRDASNLVMILLLPLLIATIFGAINSASEETNKLAVALVDNDKTPISAAYIERLSQRDDLEIIQSTLEEAQNATRLGDVIAYMILEPDFGARLQQFPFISSPPEIRIVSDPKRKVISGMITGITIPTAMELVQERQDSGTSGMASPSLQPLKITHEDYVVESELPVSAFSITVPQAALWSILACVAIMSTSLATERLQQTILRLKVSPTPMWVILSSKILSCMFTIFISCAILIVYGKIAFQLNIQSFAMLSFAILCSAFCFSGLMLAIGSLGSNPGSVAGAAWSIMVIFAMLGGGMMPQFLMPEWLSALSSISPGKWSILLMEGAIWRNYSIVEALFPAAILIGLGGLGCVAGVRNLNREKFI